MDISKYYQTSVKGIACAILIVASLWFNLFSAVTYELDKLTFFRLGVEIMLILWLVSKKSLSGAYQGFNDRLSNIKFFSIEFLLIAYFFAYCLATFCSISFVDSFYGFQDRLMGLFTIGHAILFVFLLQIILNKKTFYQLIRVLTIVSLPVAIYAILQQFKIDFSYLGVFSSATDKTLIRSFATFGHPNYLSAFIILVSPFSWLLIVKSEKLPTRIFFAVIAILQLVTLVFTYTRSAWAAFAVSLVFFLSLLIYYNPKSLLYRRIVIGTVIIAALFGVIAGSKIAPRLFEKYENSSLFVRVQDYTYAWHKVWQRPFLGYGPDTYYYLAVERTMSEAEKKIDIGVADRTHNVLLDTLINIGLIGFIIYVLIWAKVCQLSFRGIKKQNLEILALSSSLLGYFLWLNLNFDFSISLILFAFNLACLNAFSQDEEPAVKDQPQPWKFSFGLILLCLIIITIGIYFNVMPSTQAVF